MAVAMISEELVRAPAGRRSAGRCAVCILRTFYTADYRQRDHWLGVPLNVG
jgi:hypothetical protein